MGERFNREMLALARDARRMTQKALAESSGLAQGTISKIENGQLDPTPEAIGAMARALRFPRTLFEYDTFASAHSVAFYRKKASVGATDFRQLTATLTLLREQLVRLVRSVENLPSVNVPEMAPGPQRSAADLAREIRVAWRVPRGPIEDLTALLESEGVLVVPTDFGADGIEGISIRDARRGLPPVMFVNVNAPFDRVRFTMAHELGHMIMHHHQQLPPEGYEDEADEFASEFLMPATDIRPHLSNITIDRLAQLKAHWRVSMQSILVRARSLERISAHQSKRLWMQLSALGYRTREPVTIAREEPSLVPDIVHFHLEELGYTHAELAAALNLIESEFRERYLGQRPGLRLVP